MIIEEMQTYYGRRASVYDSSMGYDDDAKVRSLLPIIERVRETMRGRHVLEIACGPGFWTQFASESAATVVATDYRAHPKTIKPLILLDILARNAIKS
jgi:ubiquinone/menaquinone biosynthesis C-methylase UbiE